MLMSLGRTMVAAILAALLASLPKAEEPQCAIARSLAVRSHLAVLRFHPPSVKLGKSSSAATRLRGSLR